MSNKYLCNVCRKGKYSYCGSHRYGSQKPKFKCGNCEHTFTSGDSGGEYADLIPEETYIDPKEMNDELFEANLKKLIDKIK